MTRKEWCYMVANACSPAFPGPAMEALVGMLPLLANWPDAYFDGQSVADVATGKRRQAVPAADEISMIFRERRLASMPASVRMGGDAPPGAAVERLARSTFQRHAPEEIEHVQRVRDEAVAELKASADARKVNEGRPDPKYLDKLTLARMASPEILEGRPDLRQVLRDYEVACARRV